MKLLLTSGGVTNASIREALTELLDKPIEESSALVVPTAQWGQPMCSAQTVWKTIADGWDAPGGLCGLGWKSIGVLELTALPSIDEERWTRWVRDADALLVDGGEASYLSHWIKQSGLGQLLPELQETVWLGVSAGSMALTPRVGREFLNWRPEQGDETLGLVDFSIFPHLDYPGWPDHTIEHAQRWARNIPGPAYALDDQSAIRVENTEVKLVSEGRWELLKT
ncbi:Type 1 glutamine amidotransferase-like domain-containing protein [Psychromicrobium lacuslunae]|uniref:Peptidase S51 n=1 Tax=Psychromicrobium lacuslunae TaxID=1618207 RepID=A0A0D4BXZ9_9MICC|nr:Type 1 glutamine amidotransferase-like domain-containing protein [Psychromicrobium lacuslunae]AJT41203.1 peptidase S51 [Psychromicrobium lacuslunae]